MRFSVPHGVARAPGVLPLLSVAFVPAVIVLAMACASMNRAEEAARLPAAVIARPPAVAESPVITVELSRQGAMTIGGQEVPAAARAAAWQRERAAVGVLGFKPSQATVVVHCAPDAPTSRVQQAIEQAQQAGFQRCVLRGAKSP